MPLNAHDPVPNKETIQDGIDYFEHIRFENMKQNDQYYVEKFIQYIITLEARLHRLQEELNHLNS